MDSEICSTNSALQLAVSGLSFLTAVILLDSFWVRAPEEIGRGDPSRGERRQSLLNLFVALGATGAAAMLLVWASSCGV